MLTCRGCGREYINEDDLIGPADGSKSDEFVVFDGHRLRYVCTLCGGLVYSADEMPPAQKTPARELAA